MLWETIRISTMLPADQTSLAAVTEALRLLRASDVRRYKRLLKHVRWIVIGDWKNLAFYYGSTKVCGIKRVANEASGEGIGNAILVACLLVHEATHGALDQRRFSYTRNNRGRLEHICLAEELRFLNHFPQHKIGRAHV